MEVDGLPPIDQIEGLDAPPRMSQEINPQNLADLFAADAAECDAAPGEAPKATAGGAVPRSMAFAGARIDDEYEMKKLQVFVRIRPTATANAAALAAAAGQPPPASDATENCVHANSRHTLAIAPPEGSQAYRSGDRGQTFTFSQVFDASTSQEAYYEATASPLVQDMLRNPGHNSVMMAYGITAAGKTHTIEGNKAAPGVLPRALSALFEGIAGHVDGGDLAVRVSYCEIYNEAVYDLLEEGGGGLQPRRQALRLAEDVKTGRVVVAGLSEVEVGSADEALAVLRRGAKHRQRAETGLNYASSRSHSIFGIALVRKEHQEEGEGEEARPTPALQRLGRMAFVDLAGSERAQRTGNVGIRLKESVAINSSLMTLGRCLEALRWNQQQQAVARAGGAPAPLKVVPFRESKVTHLFRDALHGYGRVVLSVNVSPCARDYDETAHVLRYAALATAIGTLQQAEAPRRTIRAVTPGALRRAKRRAEAKAAKEEAKKKKAEEDAAAAAAAAVAAKAAEEEAEAVPAEAEIACDAMEEDCVASPSEAEPQEARQPTPALPSEPPATATKAGPAGDEEEVIYEVMGRRQLSDEFDCVADVDAVAAVADVDDEMAAAPALPFSGTPASFYGGDAGDGCGDGTPSTPCSDGDDGSSDGGDDAAGVAALQAQVQQLIADLQAAEERAVLLEGEVREEVAAEMAGLLRDMEESYKERLAAEVAAAEARAAAAVAAVAPGAAAAKKGGKAERGKRAKAAAAEEESEEAGGDAAALAAAQAEIATLRAELELQQAEARNQAARVAAAEAAAAEATAAAEAATSEAAAAHARAEELAAALSELRRRSDEVVAHRLREEVTQLEANAAMEVEMAEHAADRLRKENAALRRQLAAAMATLETVASPSVPLLQRMAAACPGGGGCGAGGTPHDVALARARAAAAAEDAAAAAAALGSQGSGPSTGPKRSRFAAEALAAETGPAAAAPAADPSQPQADSPHEPEAMQEAPEPAAHGSSPSPSLAPSWPASTPANAVEDDEVEIVEPLPCSPILQEQEIAAGDDEEEEEGFAVMEAEEAAAADAAPTDQDIAMEEAAAEATPGAAAVEPVLEAASEEIEETEEVPADVPTAAEPMADQTAEEEAEEEMEKEEEEEPQPAAADDVIEAQEEVEVVAAVEEAPESEPEPVPEPEEAPKPARRRRRAATAAVSAAPADEGEQEEAAPRRRRRAPRAVTPPSPAADKDEAVLEPEPQSEPEEVEKPKAKRGRPRGRKAKAAASDAAAEDIPATRTRRRAQRQQQQEEAEPAEANVAAELSEVENEAEAEEAPKPPRRQRARLQSVQEETSLPDDAPTPAGAKSAGAGGRRKRRLLQPTNPLTLEMKRALGDVADGELVGGARATPAKAGLSMAAALGLTPARQRSPKRTRRADDM